MSIRHARGRAQWRARAVLFLLAAACAACANDGELHHPAAQGWVDARIMHIREPLRAPLAPQDDCRAPRASGDITYAEVGFWWHGIVRRRVARLPQGSESWHDGDFVVVNLRDCDAALSLR